MELAGLAKLVGKPSLAFPVKTVANIWLSLPNFGKEIMAGLQRGPHHAKPSQAKSSQSKANKTTQDQTKPNQNQNKECAWESRQSRQSA